MSYLSNYNSPGRPTVQLRFWKKFKTISLRKTKWSKWDSKWRSEGEMST